MNTDDNNAKNHQGRGACLNTIEGVKEKHDNKTVYAKNKIFLKIGFITNFSSFLLFNRHRFSE